MLKKKKVNLKKINPKVNLFLLLLKKRIVTIPNNN